MDSEGGLIDLLKKGPIWAGQVFDGDSVPFHGGTKQRTVLSTEGVN